MKYKLICFIFYIKDVPTVLMKPEYDSYKLYVGQTNVNLTCLVVKAKPLDGISYYWDNPGGKANGPIVIITEVLRTDEGEYRCIATNLAGNSSVSTKQILVQCKYTKSKPNT